jgi:serine O-acetyltransferase
MSQLKELLYGDLARQYQMEGKPEVRPTFLRLLKRLLHFRFLPNVLCRGSRSAMLTGIPCLPQLLTYINVILFGLEVTPKCEIGPGVFFGHSVGTVVGAWRLGSNVTLLGGVTLGTKLPDKGFDPALRPQIGNNVLLGSGCKILGGIHIGDGVTVGANAVVLDSVEPNTTVAGVPAKVISSPETSPKAQSAIIPN